MDPLSITASTITLIHAAGAIATSLHRLSDALRTAESRVTALCDELSNLTAFLEAVKQSLKGCSSLDLAAVDEDLWRQTEVVMADCQTTLDELGLLVDSIRETSCVKGFGWKTRVAIDLSVRGAEIAALRDKISKSTSALRTILHTITVSLALRNNASHEVILFELDQLKLSITEAIRTSRQPTQGVGGLPDSGLRIGRNLRNLAEAASQFHSVASSTASTIANGSRAATMSRAHSNAPMSLVGAFPSFKRAWVETYLSNTQQQKDPAANLDALLSPSSPHAIPAALDECPISKTSFSQPAVPWSNSVTSEFEDEDELEFEQMFLEGLEDLARDSIRSGDFNQAIALLCQARNRHGLRSPDGSSSYRLDVQLALCYLFKGDQRQAEPTVLALAALPCPDMVVCTMIHAVSLAHLKSYSFERALELCKQALHGKKKWFRSRGIDWRDMPEYAESLGLLATIFDMMGDYISAEIYRRHLPCGYVYKHPESRFEFISDHTNLLQTVFGTDLPAFCQVNPPGGARPEGMFQLDGSCPHAQGASATRDVRGLNDTGTSPLRTKRYEWERYESDTNKEVVFHETDSAICIDDEELSPSPKTPAGPASPLKRRLSRMFGPVRYARTMESQRGSVMDDEPKQSSPIARWFKDRKAFRLGKSNSLQQSDGDGTDSNSPKTFKLLRMQRMTLEDLHNPSYQPGPGGYSGSQMADQEESMNISAKIPCPARVVTARKDRLPEPGNIEHDTPGDDSASFVAGGTPSEYYSSSQLHPPADGAAEVAELLGSSSEPDKCRPRDMNRETTFISDYSLSPPRTSASGGGQMSFLATPDYNNPSPTSGELLAATCPRFWPDMPRHDPSAQPPDCQNHVHYRSQWTAPTMPGCDNPATLLASVARILALVPTLESAESRRVVRVKLKSLAARLKLATSDMQVVYDVQNVNGGLADRQAQVHLIGSETVRGTYYSQAHFLGFVSRASQVARSLATPKLASWSG
ncbi:uncharacterized protein DNG_09040 [Cephalotrichum gorgonifer]|uniref:Fungal N-terminal domain-containing protein n=1 Tax=Cephalotrichum gorgonifer TaxID=2041049 RepID=A0AAE8N4V5_9PEZI|nr:uncharacterized protein DNG_09040 [Cephalotrichum gorgonifer]